MKNTGLGINLLSPTKDEVKYLGEVTSLNSLQVSSTNFDPEGLYSVEYFGVVGSKDRLTKMAYIDVKIPVIHPKVYDALMSLDGLYQKIISGKTNVIIDKKERCFVEDPNGESGYTFFINNIDKIELKRNESEKRDAKIDLVYKAIKTNRLTYSRLYVLPAGMREYEITADNRPSEDEINDLYRKLLRDKDLIIGIDTDDDLAMIDPIRLKLQDDIVAVYDYIKTLVDGKHKFIRGKWIKAGVTHGTRNVFSGMPTNISNFLELDDVITPKDVVLGVLQTAKAFAPLVYHEIKNRFINNIIDIENESMLLINDKGESIRRRLKPKEFDKWSTRDGIDSIVYRTISDTVKNLPIVIDNNYLAMIFEDGQRLKVVTPDIVDTIEDKTKLRPITYGEFLFFVTKDIAKEYPVSTTRHPVIENGSTYYARVKLRTTSNDRIMIDMDTGEEYKHYPKIGDSWVNTIGLHYSRLAGMGADFDGDTGSIIAYLTIDAMEEAKRLMKEFTYYVNITGSPTLDLVDDILEKVVKTLTRKIKKKGNK
jgi:hypothetical protein